ncbi:MAG: hypothetical protein H7Z72_07125 [Bacteroidetes bacterium]|nr:hypothetical protein [Fibrella sp.]
MDITLITDSELNSEIELYQGRIETLKDHINDFDDAMTLSGLTGQLQKYRTTLQLLQGERQRRLSPLQDSADEVSLISPNYIPYENGMYVCRTQSGEKRGIKLGDNPKRPTLFTITIHDLTRDSPNNENNVLIGPIKMENVASDTVNSMWFRSYEMDATDDDAEEDETDEEKDDDEKEEKEDDKTEDDETENRTLKYGLTIHMNRLNGRMFSTEPNRWKIVFHDFEKNRNIEFFP